MITKNDCLLLLKELSNSGIDTTAQSRELLRRAEPTVEIIKFINTNRQLDVTKFYEKIRKSYNNKKSSLYINIVKEIKEPYEVLTTLSAMETQILLFAKNLDNKQMFLKHARADEISLVLNNYFNTYSIEPCIKLLRLIKADLKVLEYVQGREVE